MAVQVRLLEHKPDVSSFVKLIELTSRHSVQYGIGTVPEHSSLEAANKTGY